MTKLDYVRVADPTAAAAFKRGQLLIGRLLALDVAILFIAVIVAATEDDPAVPHFALLVAAELTVFVTLILVPMLLGWYVLRLRKSQGRERRATTD
jgi:Kef-type K+ transport system membrane component KefB